MSSIKSDALCSILVASLMTSSYKKEVVQGLVVINHC
jgi:hypothetical protein